MVHSNCFWATQARWTMPTQELAGCAIPIPSNFADHTYVRSESGVAWPCFGRSSGGKVICSGHGSFDHAQCLALPTGSGGITYGVTGVCHQAANRILWPAGTTVSNAKGARGSIFVWGVYGRDLATGLAYSPRTNPWPEFSWCSQNHTHL